MEGTVTISVEQYDELKRVGFLYEKLKQDNEVFVVGADKTYTDCVIITFITKDEAILSLKREIDELRRGKYRLDLHFFKEYLDLKTAIARTTIFTLGKLKRLVK